MKKIVLAISLGIFIINNSCDSVTVVKEYYSTGELKTETRLKNGLKHGFFKEYYKNGKVKLVQHYRGGIKHGREKFYDSDGAFSQTFKYNNGKRVGKAEIFYRSGKILEYQYYDADGHLVDFERFYENGTRKNTMFAIGFLHKDTVDIGEELKYTVRLGNLSNPVYNEGELLITTEMNSEGIPLDTLVLIPSDNNRYEYVFKAANTGTQEVKGCLQYLIPTDTSSAVIFKQFCFIESYYVKGSS